MNAIEVKNLNKQYKDFTLDNVSFTLPSGCILGLVGENGAGKSTTIKLLLDMINKNGGEIKLLGQDYKICPKDDIGVVMEENGFPEVLTADEINGIFGKIYKNWNEREYYGYLKRFELPEKKKIKEYSRGMKMKLYISVALSHNAKLLILDEATSGIDPVVRDEILEIFNEFTRNENHSILISSHIVSDLEKLCDYIAFMHKGKLVLFEEKDELLNNYCIVQCSRNELDKIEKSAVLGRRETPYGIQAVIKKTAAKDFIHTSAISLDLFVYMIRGNQE